MLSDRDLEDALAVKTRGEASVLIDRLHPLIRI
jgi:hypothetical protein